MKTIKNNLIVRLLICHIKSNKKLYKSFNFSNIHQKYSLDDYLIDILYILKTGIPWRDLRSHINWISVYKVYVKLNTCNIFRLSYIDLMTKYLKKNNNRNMKYIISDTSFIPNKKGRSLIGYNKYYNKKNGTKISLITDSDGITIFVKCYKGNESDSKILTKQFKCFKIINQVYSGKFKQYFLADPGYDTKQLRMKLTEMNYDVLIVQNRRNIKDKNKIVTMNDKEKKIYTKRLVIERTFNKLKMNRRLCLRYESKIENFMGFIYLGLIKILIN